MPMSEINLLKSSHFLSSFELLGKRKNLHLSLRLLYLQSAAKHTTIVANAPKLLPDHNGTVSLNGRICREKTLPETERVAEDLRCSVTHETLSAHSSPVFFPENFQTSLAGC